MSVLYNNWCRLCGISDAAEIDIFSTNFGSKNLKELILQYFSIMVNFEDEAPKKICINCYEFMKKLVEFNETVEKANQMYFKLLSKKDISEEDNIENNENDYNICDSIKSEAIGQDIGIDNYVQSNQVLPSEHVTVSIKIENSDCDGIAELEDSLVISSSEKCKSNVKVQRKTTKKSTNKTKNKNKKIKEDIKKVVIEKQTDNSIKLEKPEKKIKIKTPKRFRIEERTECQICNKTFSSRYFLKEHITTLHTEPQFQCEICHKKFGTEKRLRIHGDAHIPYEQRHACPYCDKKFTKAVNVKPHIRTVHLREKSFVCEECGKAFGTKGHLKDHMFTHKTEALFKCTQCAKEFKNRNSLRVHEDTHSDTVYCCPQCGLQLKTRRTLNIHMLVHSDEKKYKCEHCDMAFKRSGHLKRHLISHLGLKPYSCQFCDKTFTDFQNCRMHMKKAHTYEVAGLESIGSGLVKIASDVPTLDQLKAIAAQTSLS